MHYCGGVLAAPGSMLTPNLRLLSLLGRGGMGSVWLAEHLVLRTEVAVKLLSPELANDEEALARFRREATAIAQLKSPHVVRIHDVGTAEGTPFFVMERLEGEDLSHRLDRVGRVRLGVVTAIVVQLCKALARVHELGVVHRDLKPGNVFLTDVDGDLVVKLVDFGIAKQSDPEALQATSDGAVLGTPVYMSPEQVLSTKDVTSASDLYSLGVLAYECLAGEPPFSGETLGALHVAIANGRYVPITTVDPSLPRTLDAWFARALSPVPSARFASAQEMAETFLVAARGVLPAGLSGATPRASSQALEATGAAPVPHGAPDAAPPWLRGLPFVVGTFAVLALVGGIVLGARGARVARRGAETPREQSAVRAEPSASALAPAFTPAPAPAGAAPGASGVITPNATSEPANASARGAKPAVVPALGLAPASVPAPAPASAPRPKKDRGF